MLSIETLRDFGASVDEGLERCLNKEDFYLRLVSNVLDDEGFEKLNSALAQNDLDAAFEAAHSLKGSTGNLALTPLYEVLQEVTELLRARKEMDYTEYLKKINEKRQELKQLCESE